MSDIRLIDLVDQKEKKGWCPVSGSTLDVAVFCNVVLAGKFACAFMFAAVKAPRTNMPAREATTTAAILENCLCIH